MSLVASSTDSPPGNRLADSAARVRCAADVSRSHSSGVGLRKTSRSVSSASVMIQLVLAWSPEDSDTSPQAAAAMMAGLPARDRRLAAVGTCVSLRGFLEPFADSAVPDRSQILPHVHPVFFEVCVGEIPVSLARIRLEFGAFVAVIVPLPLQTPHQLAIDAPGILLQVPAAVAPDLLRWAVETCSVSCRQLGMVSLCSVDAARSAVEPAPACKRRRCGVVHIRLLPSILPIDACGPIWIAFSPDFCHWTSPPFPLSTRGEGERG